MTPSKPLSKNLLLLVATLGAALAGLSASGCNNECDFFERCNGDVREVCGDGPDQTFNRKLHRLPCSEEAPSTACVEVDEDNAQCVLPEKTRCDDAFERSCDEDGVLLTCSDKITYTGEKSPPRYVVGTTCESDDRTCVDYGNDASCVEARP